MYAEAPREELTLADFEMLAFERLKGAASERAPLRRGLSYEQPAHVYPVLWLPALPAVLRGLDTMRSRGVKGKDFKDGAKVLLRASSFGHPLKVRALVVREQHRLGHVPSPAGRMGHVPSPTVPLRRG